MVAHAWDLNMEDNKSISLIYDLLLKHNLKSTLKTLLIEANVSSNNLKSSNELPLTDNFRTLLCLEGAVDDEKIPEIYATFVRYIQNASESIKSEASLVILPVFVHLFLHFICKNNSKMGKITPLIDNKFTVTMSEDSFSYLKKIIESSSEYAIIMQILLQNIRVIVHHKTRSKTKVYEEVGSMLGESPLDANRAKILYGVPTPESESTDKSKSDTSVQSYNKLANHMVCPESSRIPYYDMYLCQKNKPRTEFESTFMQNKWADNASRQNLSASLPSACVYTILNSRNKFLLPSKRIRTNNTVFTDDSSLLAAGMSNSTIKIWSLTFQKLKMYKPIEELQKNDKSSCLFDIYDKVLNERYMILFTLRNCPDNCTFEGHSGSVYGLCFNPYNTLLLSGASDGHIRLWQMYTHSCLSLYKGHVSVVWDVQFCPRGYYFSSCGNDQTVRLWSVENDSPLRLLVGHYSDVYVFLLSNFCAPNRTVRIWDLVSGMSVRLFSGFKLLEQEGAVHLYDIAEAKKAATLLSHTSPVVSMSISYDQQILATGGLDCSVILWNIKNCINSYLDSENTDVVKYVDKPLSAYYTKRTPIYAVNFNNRNVITCCGEYRPL
ncbi:hypothetical protein HZS_2632 [Henneguya salminicola]|nr:hypothetical protein HZS_2632 [Henneguya salminicola]